MSETCGSYQADVISVVQNADKMFTVIVEDPIAKQPVNWANATNIVMTFRKNDGTLYTITPTDQITVINSPISSLQVLLPMTQINLLALGPNQPWKLSFNYASKNNSIYFKINVEQDQLAPPSS